MQRKTLVFGLLGLMGVLVVLAYAAGQQSNRLSAEQTNFNGYQSENHAKRLTAQVWDATMNALTTWAKNHESRLQVHGSVPGYSNLTDDQISFSNLLANKNDGKLTSAMRDGLVTKLTMVVTNHEMRLRALENKPVVKNGSCVGEYQDGTKTENVPKKVPVSDIRCYINIQGWYWQQGFDCDWYKRGNRITNYHRNSDYDYWFYVRGTFYSVSSSCKKNLESDRSETVLLDSCLYDRSLCSSSQYCETKQVPIKKSCSDFNETACKTKSECTWKQ